MLRGLIISPDVDLAERLARGLTELGLVTIVRSFDHYPNAVELTRAIRATAPAVSFISVESMPKVQELLKLMEADAPGMQLIAISRECDPQTLLESMRIGIREFVSMPFPRQALQEALARTTD